MRDVLKALTIVIKDGYRSVAEPILDPNIALICPEMKCENLLVLFNNSFVNNGDISLHALVSWY